MLYNHARVYLSCISIFLELWFDLFFIKIEVIV